MTSDIQYIAIDIAKHTLQVHSDLQSMSLSYDQDGLKQLRAFIKKHQNPMVIAEATGGYERTLMSMLFSYDIAVALVNPARARAFANSEGIKAKSDPIDAKMLLSFAKEKKPKPTEYIGADREELVALMDRRAQLTEHIAREKNRLDKSPQRIIGSIKKMIRALEKELKLMEKAIEKLISSNAQMKEQNQAMQQVSGVGRVTAWSILAYLSEISFVNRNQAVALAGLAPYDKDSGKYKGKRRIQGGRAKVRAALYMAAVSASSHNPVIKPYIQKLKKRGKTGKQALVAAMRKLLIHLQSLIKKQQIILD